MGEPGWYDRIRWLFEILSMCAMRIPVSRLLQQAPQKRGFEVRELEMMLDEDYAVFFGVAWLGKKGIMSEKTFAAASSGYLT